MQSIRPARQVEDLHARIPTPLADALRRQSQTSGASVSEVIRSVLLREFFPTPADREARP